ncbi:RNA methyltransferase [Colwellia sp. MEBiC06753]
MTCYIGLTNPKGPTNVGSVLRAAGCFDATGVFYTGSRYDRAAKYQTDTNNAKSSVNLTAVDDLISAKPSNCQVICVDLVEGAIPLPDFQHPENALYIFGPEDGTITQEVINQADAVVYIPTIGCLNLAASVNVVLYDRQVKLPTLSSTNHLILTSRDTNNRTKVKATLVSDNSASISAE